MNERVKSPPTQRLPLVSIVSAQAPVLRLDESSKGVQCRFSPVVASHAPTHLISSMRDQLSLTPQSYLSW